METEETSQKSDTSIPPQVAPVSLVAKRKLRDVAMSVIGIILIGVMIVLILVFVLGYFSADVNPQNRSRDAHRISDIGQLQLALELYFDAHHTYPPSLELLAQEQFLSKMPFDPSDASSYAYALLSAGTTYALGASLENDSNSVLLTDKDTADATFPTADIKGCRGESGRHCYDVAP